MRKYWSFEDFQIKQRKVFLLHVDDRLQTVYPKHRPPDYVHLKATSKTNDFWQKRQICKMYLKHDAGGI